MSDQSRIEWIDSWKELLIFLVVLGHVVGALAHYVSGAPREAMSVAYRAIYLFHMPAFFLLVGVVNCLRTRKNDESFGTFARKRARRLVLPYFIWGGFSAVVYLAFCTLTDGVGAGTTDGYYQGGMLAKSWWQPLVSLLHAGGCPNGNGFRCNSVLWFLPCMFLTLMARRALHRVKGGWTLPVCAGCFAIGWFMRSYLGALPWGIDRVPRFLGFVFVGEVVARFVPCATALKRISLWLSPMVLLYLFAARAFPDLGVCWVRGSWCLAEVGMAVWGGLASLIVACGLESRVLRVLGGASLGIMVLHKFPLMTAQMFVPQGELALWTCWLVVGALSVGVTALALLLTKLVRRWLPIALGEK